MATATLERKPATRSRARGGARLIIPRDEDDVTLRIDGRDVELTNVNKPFWKKPLITKGDLMQYYADVAEWLVPHLKDRAMVMKRYPHGAEGEFFFMKRAPDYRPDWIETCPIEHDSGNIIHFPMVQDLSSLLWIVNLGCIDLNQWYARCDDVARPDYLHFDLDPTEGATFTHVRKAALLVHEALDKLKIPNYAKTTGSSGMHIYVPIVRGPQQKQVWSFAKELAFTLAGLHPEILTAEYRIEKRPDRHVLVDYNQNAWNRTLASVYSVRPKPRATVSMPVPWSDVERAFKIEDFRLDNVPAILAQTGDCWKPLLAVRGRFDLEKLL